MRALGTFSGDFGISMLNAISPFSRQRATYLMAGAFYTGSSYRELFFILGSEVVSLISVTLPPT